MSTLRHKRFIVQTLHRQVGEDLHNNSSQGQSPCEESRQETDPSLGSQDTNVPPTPTLLASTLLPPALDVNIQPHDPNGLLQIWNLFSSFISTIQDPVRSPLVATTVPVSTMVCSSPPIFHTSSAPVTLDRLPSTSSAPPLTSKQIPEGPVSVMVCSSTPTVGILSATVTSEAVSRSSAPTSFSQISGMPVATTHMVPTSGNHLVTSAPLRMTNGSMCLPKTSGLRTNVQGLACISKPSPSIILPLDLSVRQALTRTSHWICMYRRRLLACHQTNRNPPDVWIYNLLASQMLRRPDPLCQNDNDRESLSADSPALQQDEEDDDEEENIMPQLMGEKINCRSPRGDDLRVIHVIVRGPVNEAALNVLQETIKHENQHVREEMDKNTRAFRCLEKAVREQTETMHLYPRCLMRSKPRCTIHSLLSRMGKRGEERHRDCSTSEKEER